MTKKKVKELRYLDVVHVRNIDQHAKLKKARPEISTWNAMYDHYLVGGSGGYGTVESYTQKYDNYVIYEFSDLIFPVEYVKLTGRWSVNQEYMGEIFEIATLDNLSKFQGAPSKKTFRDCIDGWIPQFFSESTKEEFLKQEAGRKVPMALQDGKYYYCRWLSTYTTTIYTYIFKCKNGGTSCSNIELVHQQWYGGSTGNFTSQVGKDLREATADEIKWFDACEKANKFVHKEDALKSTKDFIIGKWYKSNINTASTKLKYYYIKVKDYSGYRVVGEQISSDGSYNSSGSWEGKSTIKQALEFGPVEDLSEIQPYLPINHPDKLFNSPVEELASLPSTWYCPYSNREEFNMMNDFYQARWAYYEPNGVNGCTDNRDGNHWNIRNEGTRITFEQWKKWVVGEKKESPTGKNLIGRWVKALIDRQGGSETFKGNYYKITGYHEPNYTVDVPIAHFIDLKSFALMPIGFDPEKKMVEVDSELEKWLKETKAMNLSLEALAKRINTSRIGAIYHKLEGYLSKGKAENLYRLWYPTYAPESTLVTGTTGAGLRGYESKPYEAWLESGWPVIEKRYKATELKRTQNKNRVDTLIHPVQSIKTKLWRGSLNKKIR